MPTDKSRETRIDGFYCERCGEFVPDVALSYSANGDARQYCSEKCMCKPGEADDEFGEEEDL